MKRRYLLPIVLMNLFAFLCSPPAHCEEVALDVTVALTDMEYKALPYVDGRLVFGCNPGWQNADAGLKFKTDEKGEAHLSTKVTLDKVLLKAPGDMISRLLTPPMPRDHLRAGAGLDFMGVPAIYMVDIVVFPGGTNGQEDFVLYMKDEQGNFTKQLQPSGYTKARTDFQNVVFRGPGWEPSDFTLEKSDKPGQWQMRLAFKKNLPPIPMSDQTTGP